MSKTLSQITTALESDKSAIRQAILSGGGTCPEGHGFDDFADDIDSIPSGGSSSLILNNVDAKPSIKGEFTDFPVWTGSNIISENTSGTMSLGKPWTDGTDIYHSSGTSAINKYIDSLNMWVTLPGSWGSGLELYSHDIWTDGENTYYSFKYLSSNVKMYVLNKDSMKWESKTWTFYGTTEPTSWYGRDIWTYKDTVYLITEARGSFVLNKETGNFESKSWNVTFSGGGKQIWTDGEHIYYSYQNAQYVLNEETMEWETKTWTYSFDYRGFCGSGIWTDGTDIYLSSSYSVSTSSSTYTYYVYAVLDKETDTWINKTWSGMSNWTASGIWNYKNEVYYLFGTTYKKLNKTTGEFEPYTFRFASNSNSLASGSSAGCCMWFDGSDIYYSNGTTQQVFDKYNEVFLNTTWTGLTNFYGYYIWSDGTNIYYSSGSAQYVLDKTSKTWSIKTWTGLTSFTGNYIWSDGTNIYYSSGSTQYVLDTDTSTWSIKTWTGLTSFTGNYIWSDGTNIYYSSGSSTQYVLDTDTSTWSKSSMNGSIVGSYIWSDGEHIYSNNYAYNKTRNYVTTVFSDITGYDIWTDGENIYHNVSSSSVSTITSTKVQKLIKEKNPISITTATTPNSKIPFNPT